MSARRRKAEHMRVTYDPQADAAYITLINRELRNGEAVYQSDMISTPGERGTLIADFDADGRLLGVEVLAASSVMPPELMPPEFGSII